jgi:hypothetical protein
MMYALVIYVLSTPNHAAQVFTPMARPSTLRDCQTAEQKVGASLSQQRLEFRATCVKVGRVAPSRKGATLIDSVN